MAKKATSPKKKKGFRLEVRTFTGNSGRNYLVFKRLDGGFHVFVETNAAAAAEDCGATLLGWGSLWNKETT